MKVEACTVVSLFRPCNVTDSSLARAADHNFLKIISKNSLACMDFSPVCRSLAGDLLLVAKVERCLEAEYGVGYVGGPESHLSENWV